MLPNSRIASLCSEPRVVMKPVKGAYNDAATIENERWMILLMKAHIAAKRGEIVTTYQEADFLEKVNG